METKCFITVFTPAYNRAHTLPRTYQSLKKQSLKTFEWLIVDDGSTDNTKELVQNWIDNETEFKIRYIYKENGGMHTAYNTAYANIETELNMCIDSDDCLADEAIRKIFIFWNKVRDKDYAGIIGLDADFSEKIIGSPFPKNLRETTYLRYYCSGGYGDKKLVYRTDVIKKYPPFPEYEGEHYVGISCKFVLIDQDYKLAVLDDVLCNVEYQTDSHSKGMYSEYLNNPKGFAYFRKIYMTYPVSLKRLVMDTIHYISSSILSKDRTFIAESPKKMLTLLLVPFGLIWTLYIKHIGKN